MIRVKRTYEAQSPEDGVRILVERLWPRGMKKDELACDSWLKEVAPSTELRQWFSHDVERWEEFRKRYTRELKQNRSSLTELLEIARRGSLTLLYSARNEEQNSALVLRDFLQNELRRKKAKPRVARP